MTSLKGEYNLPQGKVRKSFLPTTIKFLQPEIFHVSGSHVWGKYVLNPIIYPQIIFQDIYKISKSLEEPETYLYSEICLPETSSVVPINGTIADLKELNV